LDPKKSKKYLLLIVKALVSGTLLFLIIKRSGLANIYSTIKGISPAFFAGSVALYLVSIYISCLRWRLLIVSAPRLRRLFSLYIMGSFFNIMLPGLIGGDAVKAYYLYKETGNLPESMASIFMERYLGFTALFLIGALAWPFAVPYLKDAGLLLWAFPLFLVAFIIGSIVFFTLKAGKRIKLLSDFYGYFDFYGRKTLLKGLLYSFLVQALVIFQVFMLSKGFGHDFSILLFFVFIPVITALAVLPISISGLGIREASFVVLFGAVGMGPEGATALSFSWFLSMGTGSLVGLVEYLRIRKR